MEEITAQGVDVPALGLGTWQLTGEACREAVETALDLGYRHVDTAQAYRNERQVGAAIADAAVDRDDVFLVTKLDAWNRRHDDVLRSTEESLARLGTSYVDLLLIHVPNAFVPGAPDLAETLRAMNELVDRGRVRHVGVSNFGVDRLHRARQLSETPVLTDQVRFHPYHDQQELLDYCRIHDVLLTAYSPLAHGDAVTDPVLAEVGDRYGKSAAQVAIRWLLQQDVAVVPKATTRRHLAANRDVFDFELTDAEMERVRQPSTLRTAREIVRAALGR